MSSLSAYDSEVIGFDSVSEKTAKESEMSTQTTEYSTNSFGSQATTSQSCEIQASSNSEFINAQANEANLNKFLKRIMPLVLENLAENERDVQWNSFDSDDEETVHARLYQVLKNSDFSNENGSIMGHGDEAAKSVLGLSWSSGGNTLAIILGNTHHDGWCDHAGCIRVYTIKRSAGDKLKHIYDITQNNCITTLQYHPTISALLAYATVSGEVVVHNLRNATDSNLGDGAVLKSPQGCHGSRRVSALKWANHQLSKHLLMMQQSGSSKRRGATDEVLLSAGTDGSINVWQVNPNLDVFNNIISYQLGSDSNSKLLTPDITCFDFVRETENFKNDHDIDGNIFVVGCKSGQLILCNTRKGTPLVNTNAVNPTIGKLESHHSCVLEVTFNIQRPNMFASISTDSEIRIYTHDQPNPLKVICVDETLSCIAWVPNNPYLIAVGLAKIDNNGQLLMVYNISNGKRHAIEGLCEEIENADSMKNLCATALAINTSSQNLICVGDNEGKVSIWDIPIPVRRINNSVADYFL